MFEMPCSGWRQIINNVELLFTIKSSLHDSALSIKNTFSVLCTTIKSLITYLHVVLKLTFFSLYVTKSENILPLFSIKRKGGLGSTSKSTIKIVHYIAILVFWNYALRLCNKLIFKLFTDNR